MSVKRLGMMVIAALQTLGGAAAAGSTNEVRLTFDAATVNQLEVIDRQDGVFELLTSGSDPYLSCLPIATRYDHTLSYTIRFEYQAEKDGGQFECFFGAPFHRDRRAVSALTAAESWQQASIDLRTANAGFTQPCSLFRLDFGNQPGNRILVRNLSLVEDRTDFADLVGPNDVSLTLNPEQTNQLADIVLQDGVFAASTLGHDPFVSCRPVQKAYDHRALHMLRFEYQAEKNGGEFECYFGPPFNQKQQVTAALKVTHTWRHMFIDLRAAKAGFTTDHRLFRLDLGKVGGNRIRVRNLALTEDSEALQRVRLRPQWAKIRTSAVPVGIAPGTVSVEPTSRVTVQHETEQANATVATFNWALDLDAQTKRHRDNENDLPFAPPLATGQGEDAANHTVIRILSKYGQNEMQFLSYPPEVRGGVDVCTGTHPQWPDGFIVAAPLAAEDVRELRVFTRYGARLDTLEPPASLRPPFAIATGDFDRDLPGDEIAVSSRKHLGSPQGVFLYAATGALIHEFSIRPDDDGASENSLFIDDGQLGYFSRRDRTLRRFDASGQLSERVLPENLERIFSSVEHALVGAFEEEVTSTLIALSDSSKELNAGKRENLFWIAPQYEAWGKRHPHIHWDEEIAYDDFPEGRYMRKGVFHHLAVTKWNTDANWKETYSSYSTFEKAFGEKFEKYLKRYESRKPGMWEPTHTHRWFGTQSKHLMAESLPDSRVPKYATLDRLNQMAPHPTYHSQDLPLLNRVMTWGIRAALREIAHKQRQQPDHFVGVEPVHEMEIVSLHGNGPSLGDYNPEGIKGFYRWLTMHCGSLDAINRKYGTAFTEAFFDAPRDLRRGDWDAYSAENPFYLAWWRFNMHVIYRTIADGYREALLAGFGPETISAHQIPDLYAIGHTDTYKKPDSRVTPVDWILNAGAGYGFTRYGTHYDKPRTAINSAWTSGFGMMSLGEYAPKNPDADKSYANLAHIVDHGAYFIHHMAWDPEKWPGENKAAFEACKRLVAERDQPRSAVAGGVSKVVPFRDAQRQFDLVAIGTGPDRTGLIKSVSATGDWEGTVYVVPFHCAIEIETLSTDSAFVIGQGSDLWAPVDVMRSGSQFELAFHASSAAPSTLELQVIVDDQPLPGQLIRLTIGPNQKHHRVVYKFQVDVERVSLRATADQPVTLSAFTAYRHQETTARLREGVFEGKRHRGGVMFDVFQ
jgi:hypothetical protein